MPYTQLVLLLCCLFGLSSSASAPFFFQHHLHKYRSQELWESAEQAAAANENCDNDPFVIEDWFTQKYDQFNVTDTRTYGQRYFVNWKFHKNETNAAQPVVFLMIGGEGKMSKRWVCNENLTYMSLAIENGAIVIQLEHRFFGLNKNMPDLSTENLQYLTTEQALADIANFIPAFNKANGLINPRWVAFGGSYPGTMAALLRLKYPELTVGNVASSAPLWPKVNFWEYSDVMEKTIRATDEECYKCVGQAFRDLRNLSYFPEGRSRLSNLFRINPPMKADSLDITNFFSYVFGIFQDVIQYTYDGRNEATRSGMNIAEACRIMNDRNEPDFVNRTANLNKWYNNFVDPNNKSQSMDIRYASQIKDFQNVSLQGPEASMRGWMWLSCNEFGWLQTTDKGDSIFGDIISLGSYNKMCLDLFGPSMTGSYIQGQVAKTQRTFGFPWDYNATNVILPNGAFDPWSALGTNVSRPEVHQIALTIPGAAHCADMYAPYEKEPSKLAEARERVRKEVNYYLQSALTTSAAQGLTPLGLPLLFSLVVMNLLAHI